MNEEALNEIFNEVNMLNASIDLYSEFVNMRAHSPDEKKMIVMKLEFIREEALKHNLRIRRSIDKLGY